MNESTRRHETHTRSPAALAARGISMLMLAVACVTAYGAAPSAAGNPRLTSLQIEIWPEYDRPAALVMLNGEIAPEVALPAAVSLRLGAESGGPTAVAFASKADGNLMNLKYEISQAKDFVTVRFKAPERYFHVEFYDPLPTNAPDRRYTYIWPGDLAVGRLSVIVQEPAAASDLSVQPKLDAVATSPEGRRYHSAELGAHEAGKPFPIKISYTRTESRTSSELLKPEGKPKPATETFSPGNISAGTAAVERGFSGWLAALSGALAVLAGTVLGWTWWRRRKASSTGLCSECGNRMGANDRFCAKCGAPA